MTPADAAPAARRAAAPFVIVTVALDAMGIGLIMPVLPELLAEVAGLSISEAAVWGGWLAVSYAAMQFLFGPVLGNLSDRFGRRPVLLASLAVMAVDYLVMAAAQSLWLLFAARLVAGITGASYSTAAAYIADVTPKEGRGAAFGLIGMGFGLGFVLGPAIGGLLGELGTRAPFIAAALLAGANFVYGWLLVPESLAPENRRPFALSRSDPLSTLRQAARLPGLGWFFAAFLLYQIGHSVYPAVWSYYAFEAYGWTTAVVGGSLALVGIMMAVAQGWLIRIVLPRLGAAGTTFLGMAFGVAAMSALALGPHVGAWLAWAAVPLAGIAVIAGPAINGIMSARAEADEQGRLQGVVSSLQSVAAITSPLLMTQVFRAFTAEDAAIRAPGAPFVLAVVFTLAAVPLILAGLRRGAAD